MSYSIVFNLFILTGLFSSIFAFNVKLSPDPNVVAVGHRPVGMPLAILCVTTGLDEESKPGIVWTKVQGDISETGNVEIKKIDAFTLGLHIQNSSVHDSGVYVCTASFNGETRHADIDVNVYEELQFVDALPKDSSPNEGSTFNISCRIRSDFSTSDIVTFWEKGILALIINSENVGYTFYDNNQVLQISNYISSVHEGIYQCKVFDKRTGFIISKQIKIGGVEKKQQGFCKSLCNTLCTNLYKNNDSVSFKRINDS